MAKNYHVKGNITVGLTKQQLQSLTDNLSDLTSKLPAGLQQAGKDGDLLNILRYAGFEYRTRRPDLRNRATLYLFNFDNVWNEEIVTVLGYIANQGATIFGSFRGEDNKAWVYETQINQLIEDRITEVSLKKLSSLEKNTEILNQVATLVTNARNPEHLQEQLHLLLKARNKAKKRWN